MTLLKQTAFISLLTASLAIVLSACSAEPLGESPALSPNPDRGLKDEPPPPLPDLGVAPELTNQIWLNTPQPLRLADLQGRVVLLEFWTFG